LVLAIAAVAWLSTPHAEASNDDDWSPVRPQPAPQLKLKDHNGKLHDLKSYVGKTVIVNFWASWCAPCIEELPSLSKLNATLDPEKTVVLTVNGEEDQKAVALFLKRRRLTLTVLDDQDDVTTQAWGVQSVPTSWIVDPEQQLRYVARAEADFQSKALKTILEKLNSKK
jgi:thiol-disulfide isomerase/thioredoxin